VRSCISRANHGSVVVLNEPVRMVPTAPGVPNSVPVTDWGTPVVAFTATMSLTVEAEFERTKYHQLRLRDQNWPRVRWSVAVPIWVTVPPGRLRL